MTNKNVLCDDLMLLFMQYHINLENPMKSSLEEEQDMIYKYRNDISFKSKVDSLTYAVMKVIDRHI